jgi:Tfp pilus assembly protein PilN
MVDLHKEIKLSDLFKRKPKDSDAKAEKPEKPQKAEKPPKPPKEPRRRKERKAKKQPVTVAEHEAPPPLAIPLMRAFNLLPREEARQQAERQRPLPYVLVALAAVLVFAALAAFYLMAGADVTKKNSTVEDLRAELAGYETPEAAPEPDKTSAVAAERAGRTTSLSNALTTRLAWDRVLRELALVLPSDVSIDTLSATSPAAFSAAPPPADGSEPVHFTLNGGTDSQESVAELLARLSVIPELSNVSLQQATRVEAGNAEARHPITFTITATLRLGS